MSILDTSKTFASNDFGLDVRLVKAVAKMGFIYPTLVQSNCIPLVLEGKDVLCMAKTGSGKTIAFALPVIQKVLQSKSQAETQGIRAVILVPSRELCDQITEAVNKLLFYTRSVLIVVSLAGSGQSSEAVQKARLSSNPDIIICTPARLLHHAQQKTIELDKLEIVAVDEADLILSFGFEDDIKQLLSFFPKIFQCIFTSATLSDELKTLKSLVLHKPVIVRLEEGHENEQLKQFYIEAREKDKLLIVYALIQLRLIHGKTLFFVNDILRCYRLKLLLDQFSIRSSVLNSELPYNSRKNIIHQFNQGLFDFLIATDESIIDCSDLNSSSDEEKEEPRFEDVQDIMSDLEEITKMFDQKQNDNYAERSESEQESESEEKDEHSESQQSSSQDSIQSNEFEDDIDNKVNEDDNDGDGDGDDSDSSDNSEEIDFNELMGGESEDDFADMPSPTRKPDFSDNEEQVQSQNKGEKTNDQDYSASRGLDFQRVKYVVNVDFPTSYRVYKHRIGRTARGMEFGTALSIVVKESRDCHILQKIQQKQAGMNEEQFDSIDQSNPILQTLLPKRLNFDISEIENFRYRVDDVAQTIGKDVIREARLKELKQEILNSERLAHHFEDHPRELSLLAHDAPLRTIPTKKHLSVIPNYLLPKGIQSSLAPVISNKSKSSNPNSRKREYEEDPLRSFEYGILRDGPTKRRGKFKRGRGRKRR